MTEVMKEFIQKNEGEKIIEIEIERLRSFKNHPFQVKDDKEMYLLKESIEKYGILNPLIVRPVPDGVYIFSLCDFCFSRREKINLMKSLLDAHIHNFLFEIIQEFICGSVFVSGNFFMGLIHVTLPSDSFLTDAVDHNVRMDIAGTIVTIGMCHDKSLISGKYFLGEI